MRGTLVDQVQARLPEVPLELALTGPQIVAHRLEPVMPRVRELKGGQRHDIDERNGDDAPYEPRQHADRAPSGRRCRWQCAVPAQLVRTVMTIMFRGR